MWAQYHPAHSSINPIKLRALRKHYKKNHDYNFAETKEQDDYLRLGLSGHTTTNICIGKYQWGFLLVNTNHILQ